MGLGKNTLEYTGGGKEKLGKAGVVDYRPEPGEEGLRALRAALRGHWSPLFLRLLGRWWRGLPLGHFQRSPGVVFDLARGQLALALYVLGRVEPTSEPRPLPMSCTLYQEGSRRAGAQWCGWLEIQVPSSMAGWREGLPLFAELVALS